MSYNKIEKKVTSSIIFKSCHIDKQVLNLTSVSVYSAIVQRRYSGRPLQRSGLWSPTETLISDWTIKRFNSDFCNTQKNTRTHKKHAQKSAIGWLPFGIANKKKPSYYSQTINQILTNQLFQLDAIKLAKSEQTNKIWLWHLSWLT